MLKLQNSTINEIVTCKFCKKYFKDPVVLPCGGNICREHVDLKTDNFLIYKCQLCNENHKTYDGGFCSNSAIIDLLKLNSHLDEKSKQIHQAIDKFDESHKRSEFVVQRSSEFHF